MYDKEKIETILVDFAKTYPSFLTNRMQPAINTVYRELDKGGYATGNRIIEAVDQLDKFVRENVAPPLDDLKRQETERYEADKQTASSYTGSSGGMPDPRDYEVTGDYKKNFPHHDECETFISSSSFKALGEIKRIVRRQQKELYPAAYFVDTLKDRLKNIATDRKTTLDTFYLLMDDIAKTKIDEPQKLTNMKQAVIDIYYEIRKSPSGSAGRFFGEGSKLGDALETFIKKEIGMNVPHKVTDKNAEPPKVLAADSAHKPPQPNKP